MIVVSNTQISTKNLCERQHHYRFVQNGTGIEPSYLAVNTPLGTGLLGHSALEAYYTVIKDGGSAKDALVAAKEILTFEVIRLITDEPEQFEQLARVNHLLQLLEAYAEHYRNEPFKVLEVEKVFSTSITPDISYGMKTDILVEYTRGDLRGELAVWDHKFVFNFKSEAELNLDVQLPKYIKVLQDNGYPVRRGVFNQLRYREMKDPTFEQLFKRSKLPDPKQIEIDTIWDEQKDTAEEIAAGIPKPRRTQHMLTCKYCPFTGICKTELMGNDISTTIKAEFRPTTYGYTDFVLAGDVF